MHCHSSGHWACGRARSLQQTQVRSEQQSAVDDCDCLCSLSAMTAANDHDTLLCTLAMLCAQRAGFGQLSKLKKLRHLSLAQSFEGCTHYGLDAALVTMTGAISRWLCFLSSCLTIALQASLY